jgi:hypothetical protein
VHAARRGVAWLANAWALFARARLPWLYLLATYYVVMMAVDLVPLIGPLAVPVIKPAFAVGFLAAAWTQERGGKPRVADLFMGFRSNLRALLVLGAVFVAGITIAVLSTTLVDGGKLIDALTSPAPATSTEREAWANTLNATLRDPRTQIAMLFAVLVALPTLAAMWFAPGLVVFQTCPRSARLRIRCAPLPPTGARSCSTQWRCSCLAAAARPRARAAVARAARVDRSAHRRRAAHALHVLFAARCTSPTM